MDFQILHRVLMIDKSLAVELQIIIIDRFIPSINVVVASKLVISSSLALDMATLELPMRCHGAPHLARSEAVLVPVDE